jgi:RHS repeat-associated protein
VNTGINQAPVITIASTWSDVLPNPLTINYTVTDDGLPAGGTLTVSWQTISTPTGATVNYQNQTPSSISVAFDTPGSYVLQISATDTQLTTTRNVTVTVTGTLIPPPTVSITSPVDGASVTTQISVTGTVTSAALSSWTLEYEIPGGNVFLPLATGTAPVTNGILGTFDPTLLLNGVAFIQLQATDTSGQTSTAGPISVVVTKNQKIGNFTVSFIDLTVPTAGLPLQIVRTYDSRNKLIGDFGVGWKLDITNVQAEESRITGDDWTGTTSGGAFPTYCIEPAVAHVLTATLPDGTNYTFDVSLTPQCQELVPPDQVTVGFTPRPGTIATLSVIGGNQAYVSGSFPGAIQLFDLNTGQLIDATQLVLTLPDGRALTLGVGTGLQSITDLNGNTITITPTGIQHSSGKSVVFQRDVNGRITQITDPAGNILQYTYDLNGNLGTFTDAANNVTTFTYDSDHGLLNIQDPLGIQPIRNVYDSSGRLIQTIDAFGKVINYNNSIGTSQEIVTDRLGNQTVNAYDADGNIVQVTDALGGVTLRTYDGNDNLLSETNPLGETRSYTYDTQNNRLSETDPLGDTTTYTYNSIAEILTTTDPLGHVTTNTYDADGNLLTTQDAANNVTTYTYNSSGLRTSMTDPLGDVTSYQYDGFGNLTQQTDALGNVTTCTYDANGNKLSETRTRTTTSGPQTLVTSYQYDGLNRLTQTTYPDNSTTQIQYNVIGKQSVTIDQLGRQTMYQYDAMGRLIQTGFPDGTTEGVGYDAENDRTSSTDRAGRTTTYAYDPLKRLTTTTYADGATAQTAYDAASEVTQVTDARGNITQYAYDNAGRRTSVTDALTHTTSFTYDAAGNQLSMKDANGNTTQYQYDPLNRRTRITYPDTTFESTVYDALGRTVSKTDQAGVTTQFQYDKLGRLTHVTDALSQITSYAYDEVGNRVSQTDANSHTTAFAYDQLGRRTQRTLPLGMSETMTYDAVGNLKTTTDFDGKTTAYNYDTVNRLTSRVPDASFGATSVGFTYTSTGQRQMMTDASGTTNYTYDLRDRLTQKATPEGTLSYAYDLAGNLSSIGSSNTAGTSVNYTYDALNRLTTVKDNRLASGTTTYAYDNVGNLLGYLYPNGAQTSYTYNTLNRLTNVSIAKGGALASYAYTLGAAGNRTQVTEFGGRQVNYTYDALYRLKTETIAGGSANGTIGYQYDAVGNRLQRTSSVAPVPAATSSYDANDRLSTDSYDQDGNTIASGGNTYAYDFENHLQTENAGGVTIVYDGDGNRVSKSAGGVTTKYLVDDRNLTGYAQVLEEISAGTVQRVYSYGLNRISQSQASGTSFYGYDGHGSVRLLTDVAGAVTDRYDCDAFGNIINQAGTTPNVYLYSGEQNDPSLGLYYLRARYMNQSTGRFWTMDTDEGNPDAPISLDKYTYVGNEPVLRVDPSGNQFDLVSLSLEVAIASIILTIPDIVEAPAPPFAPACSLEVESFPLNAFGGYGPDLHGSLYWTSSIGSTLVAQDVIEGYVSNAGLLNAAVQPGNIGPVGNPAGTGTNDGTTKGPQVCAALTTLQTDVGNINGANITYNRFGPNSNSALRYMLQSLQSLLGSTWYNIPWTLVGYGTKLPKLE